MTPVNAAVDTDVLVRASGLHVHFPVRAAGTVRAVDGVDVTAMGTGALWPWRRRATMVFQDPYASLDPRRTIAESISEPLAVHGLHRGRTRRQARISELLEADGPGLGVVVDEDKVRAATVAR